MDTIAIPAQSRSAGKKGARAARRSGDVPCVLYGHHVDPVVLQIPERSLKPLIYTDQMHLVEISLDEHAWECILKDVAFHPVTDRPMHVDFQVLQAGENVTLTVPIRFVGTPVGQVHGGRTSFVVHELSVTCLPKHIPSQIDVAVEHVDIGGAVHVGDIDQPDLEIGVPADQVLMMVLRPRVEEQPVEEETGLEEGAELTDEEEE